MCQDLTGRASTASAVSAIARIPVGSTPPLPSASRPRRTASTSGDGPYVVAEPPVGRVVGAVELMPHAVGRLGAVVVVNAQVERVFVAEGAVAAALAEVGRGGDVVDLRAGVTVLPEVVPGRAQDRFLTGIGLAIAKRFAAEGAHVFFTGRRKEVLDDAVAEIGGSVTAVRADSANLADLDELYRAVAERGRGLDVVVANSGGGSFAPLGEIAEEQFDTTFATNVKAARRPTGCR